MFWLREILNMELLQLTISLSLASALVDMLCFLSCSWFLQRLLSSMKLHMALLLIIWLMAEPMEICDSFLIVYAFGLCACSVELWEFRDGVGLIMLLSFDLMLL